ncbi:hypothetical protein C3K47_19050 [Solitalea longa]|uniref:Uncharacterized protein n=2 Tax=Solitalea longa TaxID=2079460 RepID=A0A2S4ZWD4_9SPHI|nr:hypothetical protein C3K47_19050 [Solitalea longa]
MYWVKFRSHWVKSKFEIDTLNISVSKFLNGDTEKLIYKSPFDTVTYILNQAKPELSKFIAPYKGSENFKFVKDSVVVLDSKLFKILHFKMATGVMDIVVEHYWTSDFGVFMVHSSTWPNIGILQSRNQAKNREILGLVKAICPPFFKGKVKEIVPKN